ncbi:poly(R)-hydroxyalkanoic acid synthase subunit PhaE [Luteibacter sahnii]|uniref:poly(R)-hydroxyalkanoic acid synthase subunit PhaE n=1 Tax=Luteibacter sahnii TaxID=3021977 RepID=UPI002A6B1321|nr:poly(R)-hydroxyalkanoic acid synthase subunit PhaE [Luteibacter sp. PPL193]
MADKSHDFIDHYQAFVRDSVQAWARQFDPAPGASAAPDADIAARLFAGLGGYGEWMRAMMDGGTAPSPFTATATPFDAPPSPMPPFAFGPPPGADPGTERFEDWARVAREALSMPAFGLTREQQEEQQALLRAWIDYAEQYGRYRALLQGVHERAAETLRHQPPPSDAESMRSLYDRWVNLAEESYAEAAMSPAFRDVYAALVNAQMRLKRLQQRQVERMSAQAGLPTRKDVDSLGERLQAVRRELRQMQGLAAEVRALRAELASLRYDPPAVRTRAAPKAAPKKAAKQAASKPSASAQAASRPASKRAAATKRPVR